MVRYDFGPSLQNNNPTFNDLGNIGNLTHPRGITFVKDCNSFYALLIDETNQLAIYNRWEQQVFLTHDKYQSWDGVFNGTPQPIGTFNYLILYSYRGAKHQLKGTLELIR